MSPIAITSVQFEHHPTGFGVRYATPRVSWRFASKGNDHRGWSQGSYEIQISRQDASEPETYQVQGSQSLLVPWPSRALASRESASVKVRSHGKAKDASGTAVEVSTDWSEPAVVEVALLDESDWVAKLTASSVKSNTKEPIRPVLLRKAFSLPEDAATISKARLYITAHGLWEAFLNGKRIGTEEMAPGWSSYSHRLTYSVFDVASLLSQGASNILGVQVAEGWFAGRLAFEENRCFYGERLAVLAQLEVTFKNGQKYTLASDGSWKAHSSPILRSEIYDGEDYDAREQQIGWDSDPNFDEKSWDSAEELDFSFSKLQAMEAPPVRVLETVPAAKVFKSPSGKTLVDFGQNLVGRVQVRLPALKSTSAAKGHKITFSHAEVLEQEELGTRPLRGAKPVDNVFLSHNQPETWNPHFTFHGFRFVQIDGWPTNDGLPSTTDIIAQVLYSDMKRTGWFSCSDDLLNKLHENVLWSMRGNFLSLPTDCPQRDERLGWTGDIQVFAPTANFMFDTHSFLSGWLDDVSAEQLEEGRNGVPGMVIPDVLVPPNPPGPQAVWHDVTVLTPWDLYNAFGDVDLLRKQYASMKAWVDQGLPRGPNGLWDQNVWQFGDWLDPAAPPDEPAAGRTDVTLVADAYLVRVLETISKVSTLLGEKEDAAHYSEDAHKMKKAFQNEYVTPSGLLVGDTQTAHALALCFSLFESKEHEAKSLSRLSHLVHSASYRIATGFAGTPLITHALSDAGSHQLAYRMLLEKKCPSWLYPITMGSTTIWERWDSMLPNGSINPGEMTSFNHYALGSVANWMHKNIGGISPLEPGWQKIKIKPVPGGTITSSDVAYESPYGRIECTWNIDDSGKFHTKVIIPPNSSAVVVLPSEKNSGQQEEEKIEVGSGIHEFSCAYKAAEYPPKAEFERSTFRLQV